MNGSTILRQQSASFFTDRLAEESRRARRRRPASVATQRGLRTMREVVEDLRTGRSPDRACLSMMALAYAGHPDYRTEYADAGR